MKRNPTLSHTEINWIVRALQHRTVALRSDMESCDENSPAWNLGEISLRNYSDLITKLNDIANTECKNVRIIA